MRILELVTDFEPICFEKNVHFLARDNELYTWQRSPICQNVKTHAKTLDHVKVRNSPECRSIVGFQTTENFACTPSYTVLYPVSNISEFRIVASLTRLPDIETDSLDKTWQSNLFRLWVKKHLH